MKQNITDINTLSRKDVLDEMKKAKQEKRRHFYFKHQTASGEIKNVEIYSGPIKFNQQKFLYSIIHDITERKKAEKALQESEEKYRLLFKHAPVGLFEIDLVNYKFVSVNDGLCDYCGYTEEEFLSMNPIHLISDECQTLFLDRFSRLMAGEKIQSQVEYDIVKKDGGIISALFNIEYIYEDGTPVGALCVAHDITERKKAEKEKENLIQQLQNALDEIQTLQGIIPICSGCKKIRDDKGYWNLLESYIEKYSSASFTHSLCPDCSDKYYGDEAWYIEMKKKKNDYPGRNPLLFT